MHRFKAQIRRYRVQTRPRVRSRRIRESLAVSALLVLAAAAALTVPRLLRDLPDSSELVGRLMPRAFVLEGVPPELQASFSSALDAASGLPRSRAALLKSRYPIVRAVGFSRDWPNRRIRFKVELREPLARVVRDGRALGYLAADGVVFTAPDGIFPDVRPDVDVGSADAAERLRLARCLEGMGAKGSLPALERMTWAPRLEGWEARFEDGTTVLWGDLRWTEAKALRLRQALEDFRKTLPLGAATGALTADLRYFEDGKIFVRPSPQTNL
ncbi:MAG: hypothetical protein HY748_05925 [Elusimicrobia bacterium]|nr:hypothetical protein [Elusimicrobiota bacterium]